MKLSSLDCDWAWQDMTTVDGAGRMADSTLAAANVADAAAAVATAPRCPALLRASCPWS